MGLDMYLSKYTYVQNWDYMQPKEKHQITVMKDGKPVTAIKPERISHIVEQVAYWRKANAIHKWFVDNTQDGNDECNESPVSTEQLTELVYLCERILAKKGAIHQAKLADELLPPQEGFFFGDTTIDEYYLDQLRETVEMLRPMLAEPEQRGEFRYQASW